MAQTIEAVAPATRPAAPRTRRLSHIPALDGLRGAAVLGVLAYHADHLGGGFLGVDLFFVLSGFLITGLLLTEADDTGRIDLPAFWARRIRRLLPALLVVLVAVMAYGAAQLEGSSLADLRTAALGTLAYVANWVAIDAGHDYWAAFGEPGLLDHTWSLAIEEQFYLVWPVLGVVAVWLSRGRRAPLVVGTVVLTAASLVSLWMHHGAGADTSRAYYGTDTRAAAVLYGALVAMVVTGRPRHATGAGERWIARAAWPAALVLAWLWVVADGTDGWLYRWGLPLAGISAAVIIAAITSPRSLHLHRLLSVRPLCWIGLISYGLYLWHWPVYQVLDAERLGFGGLRLSAVRIGVSVALAAASYQLLERPIRHGAVRPSRWRLAVPMAMAGVACLVVVAARGTAARSGEVGEHVRFEPEAAIEAPGGSVLLLGDSQAIPLAMASPGVVAGRPVGSDPVLGCGIGPGVAVVQDFRASDEHFEKCGSVVDTWLARIEEDEPGLVVLHTGAWDVLDHDLGDRVVRFGTEEWDEITEAHLRSVLGKLGGSRVVALTVPCYAPEGKGGGPVERGEVARVERWNEHLRTAAAAVGARVLDYGELLCPDGVFLEQLDGQRLRPDGVHLTSEGSALVWGWLSQELTPLLQPPETAESG